MTWIAAALALSWLAIAGLAWFGYQSLRQHGRLLLKHDELQRRVEALEQVLATFDHSAAQAPQPSSAAPAPPPSGLAAGTLAPAFSLPDLCGQTRRLEEFKGQPLLLLFFSPTCGFCQQMAPRLGHLPIESPRVLLISRGDVAEHRRLAEEHRWQCDVVLDQPWEVAKAYQAYGTPMGYLLDADGRVASPLAAGADAVLALAASGSPAHPGAGGALSAAALETKESAAAARASAAGLHVRESTLQRRGLPAGTPAPAFRLPDLAGAEHALAEFRGKRVLLVFSDPECGPCQVLAPRLEELYKRQRGPEWEIVMVGRGDPAANRDKARSQGLTFPILLQRRWEVSKEYAMFATPVAYLIDELGVIADEVAMGPDPILALAERAAAVPALAS